MVKYGKAQPTGSVEKSTTSVSAKIGKIISHKDNFKPLYQ